MTNAKTYSLCEAVAEIEFIAAREKYETQDSREKFVQFIDWAKEFEYLHKDIEWGVNSELEYISKRYFRKYKN